MSNIKTAKISTLIENLQELLDQEGDLPIVASIDEEGNTFNTFDSTGDTPFTVQNGLLILYPSSERNDLEDIEGFTEEPDDYSEDYDEDNPFDDYDIENDCYD